jgi:ribosomal protein S18 acetylase RimI-like enzyme
MVSTVSSAAQGILIETAGLRDLNALRHVEKVCFPQDAWPLLDLIGVLTFPNVVRLKAVDGAQMVGFIAGDIRHAESVSWIATVGVLPEYRGRGIGARLLEECESRLPFNIIRLCVRQSNDSAIRLYKRFGYAITNQWKNYYTDGEAALVMEKKR